MRRKCFLYEESGIYQRRIYIDAENADEIYAYIEGNFKKFNYIIRRILDQNWIYYDDYKPIEIDGRSGLSEMRIHPNGKNGRIYCREISTASGTYCVIAIAVLEKKKSMKITKAMKDSLKPILDYDYEIE